MEIRNSHIVPELVYKRVYTRKHKFLPVDRTDESIPFEQKGYRERLLCQSCETKLSRWEGTLGNLIEDVVNLTSNSIKFQSVGRCHVLAGINYDHIKKAVLSIFWRMSISSLEIFSGYQLGPYEGKIKHILHNDSVISEDDFPVLISRCELNWSFQDVMFFPVGRGRYAGKYIMQTVVLNGIVFDMLMVEGKSIPKEISLFSLRSQGQVIISTRNYEELGLSLDKFAHRMRQSDVSDFFKKYD